MIGSSWKTDFRQFQIQAERALRLVSGLNGEDKIRAALLWNSLSSKLQTIIDESVNQANVVDSANVTEQEKPVDPKGNSSIVSEVADTDPEPRGLGSSFVTNIKDGTLSLGSETVVSDTPSLNPDSTPLGLGDNEITLENKKSNRNAPLQNPMPLIATSSTRRGYERQAKTSKGIGKEQTKSSPAPEPEIPAAPNPNLNKTKSWSCLTCKKVFESVEEYEDHVKTSHKPKQFKCSQCPSSFSTRGNLNVHFRIHTGERPHACSKCSSTFTSGGNLRRHLLSHQGLKPYRCSTCDSCFTEKKSLLVHQRSHTNFRPYKCPHCPSSFTQNSILTSHLTIHSNVKPYTCTRCGRKFRQKAHLTVHEQRHAKLAKHQCPKCTHTFVTSGDLGRHLQSHLGIRSYTCDHCGKGFMRASTLKEHIDHHCKALRSSPTSNVTSPPRHAGLRKQAKPRYNPPD